jgi:hypothetical protein
MSHVNIWSARPLGSGLSREERASAVIRLQSSTEALLNECGHAVCVLMPSLGPKVFPGIVKGVIIMSGVERLNVCRACGQAVAGRLIRPRQRRRGLTFS